MKQNITLSLDKELIKKAKVLAAKKDLSVTRFGVKFDPERPWGQSLHVKMSGKWVREKGIKDERRRAYTGGFYRF